MGTDEKIFLQAEENLQRLILLGGSTALALELQAALEEARHLGGVTNRLCVASANALLWWANGVIDAALEGRATSPLRPRQRHLN